MMWSKLFPSFRQFTLLTLTLLIQLFLFQEAYAVDCEKITDLSEYGIVGHESFTYGNNSEINDNIIEGVGNTPTPIGQVDKVSLVFPPIEPDTFPSGGSNVDNVTSLEPGTYNKVTMGNNDTLYLEPGDYYINEFEIGNNITVVTSPAGKVQLYIGEHLFGGNELIINRYGNVADFIIYLYQGTEINIGNANQGHTEFDFNGMIYSPYADTEIVFGNNNTIQGAILSAGTLDVGQNTYFNYSPEVEDALLGNFGCEAVPVLDHIRIEHSGATGVTCLTEAVTVKACSNEECDPYLGDPVDIVLTASHEGYFSPSTVYVEDQPVTVRLSKQTVSSTAIWATAAEAVNLTRCFIGGHLVEKEDCAVTFADVGIVIDGDYPGDNVDDDILTQIAGKSSSTAWNGAEQRIRVIRTDDQTGACVAGVSNELMPSTFSYLVPTPTEGLNDNKIKVTGNTSEELTDSGLVSGKIVQLTFDGDGTAPFHFESADAGRYSLRVDLGIPVTDADGELTGEAIAVSDTSNFFVVRPLAVFADATGNPNAQNDAGDIFIAAGEDISLTFKALRWNNNANPDGEWDEAPSSTLTDPNSYARVPSWNLGQPDVNVILPADNGELTFNGDVNFPHGQDNVSLGVIFNEVGIIQFQNVELDFMGEEVLLNSPYIGRFIPDHFELTKGTLNNRVESGCADDSSFTYLGENLEFTYKLTAKNSNNQTTSNYIDPFHKFSGDEDDAPIAGEKYFVYAIDDPNGTPLPLSDLEIISLNRSSGWANGEATFTVRLNVERGTEPDGPFDDVRFGVYMQDGDGVEIQSPDLVIDGEDATQVALPTNLRYGRMVLDNAYGPETMPLRIPVRTEYFNGSSFVLNEEDSCTPFASERLLLDQYTDNLSEGDITVSGSGLLNDGQGAFVLSAPNVENDGSVRLTYDLDAAGLSWLKPDGQNPTAKATFGIYKGHPKIIYIRESVW